MISTLHLTVALTWIATINAYSLNQAASPKPATISEKLTIVLATNTKTEQWKDDVIKESTMEGIAKATSGHRCAISKDGNNVFIIDEGAFGLQRIKTEESTFTELAQKNIQCYQKLTPNNLTASTYNYLLQHHIDTPNFKDAYEKGDGALFISPSPNFTLSANGRKLEMELSSFAPSDKMKDLVTEIPDSSAEPKRKLPAIDYSLFEVGQGLSTITIRFGGKERSLYNRTALSCRIMKMAGEAIMNSEKELKDAALNLLNGLMKNELDKIWGSASNFGATSGKYDELSEQTRTSLEHSIAAQYRRYGFNSETEAVSFLRTCHVDDAHVNMNISCIRNKNGMQVQTDSALDLRSR